MATHRQRSVAKTRARSRDDRVSAWRQDMKRHTRWLFRIPEPNNPQVGVVIGRLSEQRMHELWSRESAHVATKAQRDYIVRRVTDDPTWHSYAAWKIHNTNVRAFRRVLTRVMAWSIAADNDPISEHYGYQPMQNYKRERSILHDCLLRLKLHYSDVADALDRETDIVGAHSGMGVQPWSNIQRQWFDQAMGILDEYGR